MKAVTILFAALLHGVLASPLERRHPLPDSSDTTLVLAYQQPTWPKVEVPAIAEWESRIEVLKELSSPELDETIEKLQKNL
ncbi:hypothetical protein H4R33_004888, partial [Dimargaris cristalligena]